MAEWGPQAGLLGPVSKHALEGPIVVYNNAKTFSLRILLLFFWHHLLHHFLQISCMYDLFLESGKGTLFLSGRAPKFVILKIGEGRYTTSVP